MNTPIRITAENICDFKAEEPGFWFNRNMPVYSGLFYDTYSGLADLINSFDASEVSVFDSGFGNADFLVSLLEHDSVKKKILAYGSTIDIVSTCEDGVNSLKTNIKSHPEMNIYFGDTIKVLDVVPKQDLILDVFGAFYYHRNRLNLFNSMHNALNIGGKALILYTGEKSPVKDSVTFDDQTSSLKDFLIYSMGAKPLGEDALIYEKTSESKLSFAYLLTSKMVKTSIDSSSSINHPKTDYEIFDIMKV